MCFSAEASFTSAALLTVIGYATMKERTARNQTLLASIPLFFALQQFFEGLLWINLSNGIQHVWWTQLAEWGFLFFAFGFWPIFIPLSVLPFEEKGWRKIAVCLGILTGSLFVIINLTQLSGSDVSVKIVGNSLQYDTNAETVNIYLNTLKSLYLFAVATPLFSRFPRAWIFGLLNVLTFVAAKMYYAATFTSIWCFFAAIVSASIYYILHKYREEYGI